jgi:hypothetical protein
MKAYPRWLSSILLVAGLATALPSSGIHAAPAAQMADPGSPPIPADGPTPEIPPDIAIMAADVAAVDGTLFGPAATIAGNQVGAHSAAIADFDRDGDQDVVAASRDDGKIILYRNNGQPTPGFTPQLLTTASGVYAIAATDLNGDGDPDVAAAAVGVVDPSAAESAVQAATGVLLWLENNGGPNPTFIRRDVAGGLAYPVALDSGDLDNDGDPDLLVALRDGNRILGYRNNGGAAPSFSLFQPASDGNGMVDVTIGDLDRDGKLDFVAASENDDRIAWYRNLGGLAFSPSVLRQGSGLDPQKDYAKSVALADFNQDGRLDVAYGSEDGGVIGWYAGPGPNGGGWIHRQIIAGLDHIKMVTAADLDRDGDIDLLSASAFDNKILWYESNGAATPTFTARIVSESALGARAVEAGDLDGDGDLDLVTASRDNGVVAWHANTLSHRNALFNTQTQQLIGAYALARSVYAADLDRDGALDAISVSDGEVAWHRSNGGAPPRFTSYLISSSLNGGRYAGAADLDKDGDDDIIVASHDDNRILWYENVPGPGNPPRTFAGRTVTTAARGVRSALAADLDGDGDLDIYAATDDDNTIAWYENRLAAGQPWTRRVIYDQAKYARHAFAADVDGDGDIDLMSASQHDGRVIWYENNGKPVPSFTVRAIGVQGGPQHIHADDLDGDGDLDLMAASEYDGAIVWYENRRGSPIQWVARDVSRTASGVHAVYSGDADNDGDIDIFGAVEYRNAIIWYENNGGATPSFTERVIVDNTLVSHSVFAADMDGDGDLDLLSASRGDGRIAWYENRGGQYSLNRTAASTTAEPVLAAFVVKHNGRPGDGPAEIGALTLQLLNGGGVPLRTQDVQAAMRSLAFVRDVNGDRIYQPAVDKLVVSISPVTVAADGRLSLPVSRGAPGAQISPGGSATFFLVATSSGGVCSSQLNRFSANPILTGQTVRTSSAARPLLGEFMRTLTGGEPPSEESAQKVIFNEIMASNNGGLTDPVEAAEFPDWFELYNPTGQTINLAGKYLSDDLSNPKLYRIPDNVLIAPYGYLLFYADGEPDQGPTHVNFQLRREGETLTLYDTDAAGNKVIETFTYGEQTSDVSIGRFPNGGQNWRPLLLSTPGAYNLDTVLNHFFYLPAIRLDADC